MTKVIFGITLTIITFAITHSANTRMSDSANTRMSDSANTQMSDSAKDSMTTTAMDNSSDSPDMIAIMNACNESFRIEMAYLQALNESASFIDETDRTPKCFIRCVLQNSGIISEDGSEINAARAAMIFAGERNGKPMDDLGDMTARCAADRKETCLCDKSYKFVKCLMMMEIEKYETST